MGLAKLVRSTLVTVAADDPIIEAVREMEDNAISAVAVMEAGQLAGILTERDVIRAAADGMPLERTPIDEYMTAAPVTIPASAEPDQALRTMLDAGFGHLPVVDADDEIVGILTIADVAEALFRSDAGS